MKRKPIFNPAAVGLLVANYAFAIMQSWWGGMSLLSYWYLILLVVVGLFVTWRVKKVSQVAFGDTVLVNGSINLTLS